MNNRNYQNSSRRSDRGNGTRRPSASREYRRPQQPGRPAYRENVYDAPDTAQDNGNLTFYVLVAAAVTVIAAVLVAISLLLFGGKAKKNPDGSGNPPQNGTEEQASVVAFDETDPEEDSDVSDVSSAVAYKSFVGTWQKTDVVESQKATLTVTAEYSDSFEFTLQMWSGSQTARITGTAFYTDESTASYAEGSFSLTLRQGTEYLTLYHKGKNADAGVPDAFVIDGKFTLGAPDYIKTEETDGYDYTLYQSDAVVQALSSTLSSSDYALYQEMMTKGLKSPIAYERTLDKNGKKVNVDTELKAVKYYAHLSSIGADMIFICTGDAKIYVLFYDSESMRYYTNDPAYAKKMPASFQAVEKATGLSANFR